MTDNIFKSNAFLAALRQSGGIEYSNGGERIQIPLMYEVNNTVKSYSGYETINVVPQEGMTSAFYPYSEIAGTITISRREERQNNGEAALLNLLEKKILQAEMSIKAAINEQLVAGTVSGTTFIPGNSEKDLLPLGFFLRKNRATDPTSTAKVGGILAATYAWWKAHAANLYDTTASDYTFAKAVTTYKGYLTALRKLYNTCANGADGSAPNLLVGSQGAFELYCNSIMNQVQYNDIKLAEIGFDSVKFRGATFIYDELVPDVYSGTAAITYDSIFFLNTKYYKLTIDRETDFVTTPFVEPENQTAKTAKILFMGNATSSNQRKLGVAHGIITTITT